MSYLTCETPAFLEPFFARFDPIFKRPEPQKYFRLYGTGLLLEIKRKNVQAIDSHIISGNYQGLHHFISDAPWEEMVLNNQRLSWLQSKRQAKSTRSGYVVCVVLIVATIRNCIDEYKAHNLILDDTGNPKSGDATFARKSNTWAVLVRWIAVKLSSPVIMPTRVKTGRSTCSHMYPPI